MCKLIYMFKYLQLEIWILQWCQLDYFYNLESNEIQSLVPVQSELDQEFEIQFPTLGHKVEEFNICNCFLWFSQDGHKALMYLQNVVIDKVPNLHTIILFVKQYSLVEVHVAVEVQLIVWN